MLTIYAPFNNPDSKAWEVFNGVEKSWPEQVRVLDNTSHDALPNSMFWGFVNNNMALVKVLEARKHQYWFTDTPYFGRFDNSNLKQNNHYWRICKNNVHVGLISGCKEDRFDKFKIKVKPPQRQGNYILVCPSSPGINQYLGKPNWLDETITKIKKYTDRPIKVRQKPRGRRTSGPSEAKVPIEEDLKDAWVCVTSCSISAIESISEGVPVFCDEKSFARPIASTDLRHIENPTFADPYQWLCSLAYQQFTPEEFVNGKAVKILKDTGILNV